MESLPGATGISGAFDLDQTQGTVKLDSRDLVLDAPRVFGEPLAMASMGGAVTWDKRDGPWRVAFDNVRFASAPFTGTADGTWTAKGDGPGTLDLRAQLAGGSVDEVSRYIPLTLGGGLRTWLKASILEGAASDVRVNLAGDLADFPFADNRNGKVPRRVQGHATGRCAFSPSGHRSKDSTRT